MTAAARHKLSACPMCGASLPNPGVFGTGLPFWKAALLLFVGSALGSAFVGLVRFMVGI